MRSIAIDCAFIFIFVLKRYRTLFLLGGMR
nr:MAG TPA: hypothetical protein [Caudoviricetes sp.]